MPTTASPYSSGAREQWALAEVARTAMTRPIGWALTLVFLATIVAVPAAEIYARRPRPALGDIPRVRELVRTTRAEGPLSANRRLLRTMQAVEDSLETDSVLTRALLPGVQLLTTALLGLGTEQVIPGRDRWLFFRPDVEHLSGVPFLDAAALERRRRGGDPSSPAIQPDPLLAIEALAAQLRERDIVLILMPAPIKPMLLPERVTRRGDGTVVPLYNPSWPEFLARAQRAGVTVVDAAPALAARKAQGGVELFLRTDTHWTPEGMQAAAEALAPAVRPYLDPARPDVEWTRREVVLESQGDTVALLNLPRGQRLFAPQSVRLQRVVGPTGASWAPDASSELLLLGDSFTNVFSDASLHWGQGAGLAEQLSFLLRRGIDRLADNGGGAHGSRVRLAQELERGVDRLQGKRVVIYEFAMRELSAGDWKRADLPPRDPS